MNDLRKSKNIWNHLLQNQLYTIFGKHNRFSKKYVVNLNYRLHYYIFIFAERVFPSE